MTEKELISSLKEFKQNLIDDVISFYRINNKARGRAAFSRWKKRFIDFLNIYIPGEAKNFELQTAQFSLDLDQNEKQNGLIYEDGRIYISFIEELADAVAKKYLIVPESQEEMRNSELGKNIQSNINNRNVFVVHGRNWEARNAMFQFLRSIDLQPIEWSQAIKETGKATPYVGEILDTAFSIAQAIVVLLTPDDIAKLQDHFIDEDDEYYEKELTPQARPNVLFEAGMAMGRSAERTILVEIGKLRPFSDVGGRHVIRLSNKTQKRQELANRLETAGCAVNLSGSDWHTEGNFEINSQTQKGHL
jgi:predicted nucleotide-binding protein